MGILSKIVIVLAAVLVLILLLGWIGLKIQPRSFDPFPQKTGTIKTVPLPEGLPEPVERFYRKVYGEQIPVIESAVITGKATLRPVGPITFPGRFRITHIAGQGYRHYIEATLFGIPLFKVNERYVDGRSLMEMPWGTVDNEPKNNQGANLGLWAESGWLPTIFLTDLRAHWEPVDADTAILVVPFADAQEHFIVRFNPDSGLITYFESMRYHGPESQEKTLWINEAREWSTINGTPTMKVGAAIWMDDGKPWAVFTVEDIVFNVDVQDTIRAKGE
jgi:hypothetical protein